MGKLIASRAPAGGQDDVNTIQNTGGAVENIVLVPPQRLADLCQWYQFNLPGLAVVYWNQQDGTVKVAHACICPKGAVSFRPIREPIFQVAFLLSVGGIPEETSCRRASSRRLLTVTHLECCITSTPAPAPCLTPVYSSPSNEHFVKKARKIRGRTRKDEFYYLIQWYQLLHHGTMAPRHCGTACGLSLLEFDK